MFFSRFSKQPTKIFYLVELRSWNDGTAFPYVRNRNGYTIEYLKANRMIVQSKGNDAVTLTLSKVFQLSVQQFVFNDLDAARIHFENIKKVVVNPEFDRAAEVSLLQVEADSLRSARVLPPESYARKNVIWLEVFQPSVSSAEYRVAQASEMD